MRLLKRPKRNDGLASTEVSLPFITADASGPKHLNSRLTKAQFEVLSMILCLGLYPRAKLV